MSLVVRLGLSRSFCLRLGGLGSFCRRLGSGRIGEGTGHRIALTGLSLLVIDDLSRISVILDQGSEGGLDSSFTGSENLIVGDDQLRGSSVERIAAADRASGSIELEGAVVDCSESLVAEDREHSSLIDDLIILAGDTVGQLQRSGGIGLGAF